MLSLRLTRLRGAGASLLILSLGVVACAGNPAAETRTGPAALVTVSPSTDSMAIGATVQLAATVKDADGNTLTGRTVTWTSSNRSFATVSASGLATGMGTIAATELRYPSIVAAGSTARSSRSGSRPRAPSTPSSVSGR